MDDCVGDVADSACDRVGFESAIDRMIRIEKLTASAGSAQSRIVAPPPGGEYTKRSEKGPAGDLQVFRNLVQVKGHRHRKKGARRVLRGWMVNFKIGEDQGGRHRSE